MLKNHISEEKLNFITVLHHNKLAFNSYNAYLLSTLEKNDLKYLNISFFDHFIPIPRKIFDLRHK